MLRMITQLTNFMPVVILQPKTLYELFDINLVYKIFIYEINPEILSIFLNKTDIQQQHIDNNKFLQQYIELCYEQPYRSNKDIQQQLDKAFMVLKQHSLLNGFYANILLQIMCNQFLGYQANRFARLESMLALMILLKNTNNLVLLNKAFSPFDATKEIILTRINKLHARQQLTVASFQWVLNFPDHLPAVNYWLTLNKAGLANETNSLLLQQMEQTCATERLNFRPQHVGDLFQFFFNAGWLTQTLFEKICRLPEKNQDVQLLWEIMQIISTVSTTTRLQKKYRVLLLEMVNNFELAQQYHAAFQQTKKRLKMSAWQPHTISILQRVFEHLCAGESATRAFQKAFAKTAVTAEELTALKTMSAANNIESLLFSDKPIHSSTSTKLIIKQQMKTRLRYPFAGLINENKITGPKALAIISSQPPDKNIKMAMAQAFYLWANSTNRHFSGMQPIKIIANTKSTFTVNARHKK